jgi:molybdopterin synthase sulfur carrier subunit
VSSTGLAMKVKFKLFATLSDYLPQPNQSNSVDLEITPETTVQALIEQYQLPPQMCHLVLVNGFYISPVERATTTLKEGDVLAIWPPIAGGKR